MQTFATLSGQPLNNLPRKCGTMPPMSEKRKPDTVLLIRHVSAEGRRAESRKIEVYSGDKFTSDRFKDVVGRSLEGPETSYRLRIDGVWMPRHAKVLYSGEEVAALINQFIGVRTHEEQKSIPANAEAVLPAGVADPDG